MRICCGLTGHLELAKRADLYGRPVVVGRWDDHVIAASEEALPFGVSSGMPLRQICFDLAEEHIVIEELFRCLSTGSVWAATAGTRANTSSSAYLSISILHASCAYPSLRASRRSGRRQR